MSSSGAYENLTTPVLLHYVYKRKLKFVPGSPCILGHQELQSIFSQLDSTINTVNVHSLPDEYKTFLYDYGSLTRGPYRILGPGPSVQRKEHGVQLMLKWQREFKMLRSCVIQEGIKYMWLIAAAEIENQHPFEFYMDFLQNGSIYCAQYPNPSNFFASDFNHFLKKFAWFVKDDELIVRNHILNEYIAATVRKHYGSQEIRPGLVGHEVLESVISQMDENMNTVNADSLPSAYKLFLNTYVSLSGGPFWIVGPTPVVYDKQKMVIEMLTAQLRFKMAFANILKERTKSAWLIAEVGYRGESSRYAFFIDLSRGGYIHYSEYPKSDVVFATNFGTFLEIFFPFVKRIKQQTDNILNECILHLMNAYQEELNFVRGSPGLMGHEVLVSIIGKMNEHNMNTLNVDHLPHTYKLFLNTYGSLVKGRFRIFGPEPGLDESKKEAVVQDMVNRQLEFKALYFNVFGEQIRNVWLIAQVGMRSSTDEQGFNFYMDFSRCGYIHCSQFPNPGDYFSDTFVSFLQKFLLFVKDKKETQL